ncbi:MAG: aminotransferase class V-fold PLP-dependent enzyme, partial [Planctomycetes bacterium]|nr:aminotransferase class V-fold PLP-dependent enzyme [Planctomycetota bacterium]
MLGKTQKTEALGQMESTLKLGGLRFHLASTEEEIEQVHQLNYRALVQEIGQYEDDGSGVHVDKFHHKNLYFICRRGKNVIGMVSGHGERPFSVAGRLLDPDDLHSHCPRPFEVRLLSVLPQERKGFVLMGLLYSIHAYALAAGFSHLVISGVGKHVPLYRRIGFEPLGPSVEQGAADFTPMALDLAAIPPASLRLSERFGQRFKEEESGRGQLFSFLPGPPTVHPSAEQAFGEPVLYHRSSSFLQKYRSVRGRLERLMGGRGVALWNGTGTLANEAIAAALASLPKPNRGVIFSNGAFGDRLVCQAEIAGLSFRVSKGPWGAAWNMGELENHLRTLTPGDWAWGVHLETSTGVVNPVREVAQLCSQLGLHFCVDGVSAVGSLAIPDEVALVSGVSGKCLSSYAGISFVAGQSHFLDLISESSTPFSLRIHERIHSEEPLNTFPSSPLLALDAALLVLEEEGWPMVFERQKKLGAWVRRRLQEAGIATIAS